MKTKVQPWINGDNYLTISYAMLIAQHGSYSYQWIQIQQLNQQIFNFAVQEFPTKTYIKHEK